LPQLILQVCERHRCTKSFGASRYGDREQRTESTVNIKMLGRLINNEQHAWKVLSSASLQTTRDTPRGESNAGLHPRFPRWKARSPAESEPPPVGLGAVMSSPKPARPGGDGLIVELHIAVTEGNPILVLRSISQTMR